MLSSTHRTPRPHSLPRRTIETGRGFALIGFLALGFGLMSCVDGGAPDQQETPEVRTFALAAFCSASVAGSGNVDVESDYLAHVVSCENGAADSEALKAQAVSARTYLYYKLATSGSIGDGQGDQVYTCNRPPGAAHHAAVEATAGQVLQYNGNTIAAFYVAGSIPTTNSCVPGAGDSDPTRTERYVTYNEGRSGSALVQSTLGWVNQGNVSNRGCMSQNGSHCLSESGWNYRDILRFYYGADIDLVTAEGACVGSTTDPECDANPSYGVCEGTVIARCNGGRVERGDCGAYGASCSTEGGEPHCVDYRCVQETGDWCSADRTIGTCDKGAFSERECGDSTGGCSDSSGVARCLDARCSTDDARFCTADGHVGVCDAGQFEAISCALGCTGDGASARCADEEPVAADSEAPGVTDERCADRGEDAFCIGTNVLARCTGGRYEESACSGACAHDSLGEAQCADDAPACAHDGCSAGHCEPDCQTDEPPCAGSCPATVSADSPIQDRTAGDPTVRGGCSVTTTGRTGSSGYLLLMLLGACLGGLAVRREARKLNGLR